jgi:uncharacterized protein
MTDATRDTVARLLAALAGGDLPALRALYADRVDVRLNWPAEEIGGAVPWIRPRTTSGDMAEHFAAIAAANRPVGDGTTVERVIVDGGEGVLLGTLRNRLVGNGRAYEARFALHLTVEGGRITRHHVYEDSLAVWRAWNAD